MKNWLASSRQLAQQPRQKEAAAQHAQVCHLWLGVLKEGFDEASLHFEAEEVEVTCGFPVGELGVPK